MSNESTNHLICDEGGTFSMETFLANHVSSHQPHPEDGKGQWAETLAEAYLRECIGDIRHATYADRVHYTFAMGFGFGVLDAGAVEVLRPYAPLVEVGAGSGYWAYELESRGIDIIPTEKIVDPAEHPWGRVWRTPEELEAQAAVAKYPDRTLLMVWPDHREEWSGKALAAYGGEYFLYAGEVTGGCTGSRRLHSLLDEEWERLTCYEIPRFTRIKDTLGVFRRRARRPR